jgi:hypothetical protein
MTPETTPDTIAQRYIAAWNETDVGRRRALIAETWAEDATYVDPLMTGRGHAEVDALMGAVQQRFPGFRFALIGQPDGFGDKVRFSWGLGPDGAEAPIKGTDFVQVEDGRLKSVTGFLDQVPAA